MTMNLILESCPWLLMTTTLAVTAGSSHAATKGSL